ncbi:spore coat protein [Candidatus Amesbacteria bacterium RIFCSPLOWO2_02_FULL_48_11]|uniref:glucose-1-phosphate thymidylyltransferase n=5 Tax=Candidatus Amesiibacteriota TaxID=1752730 RepID=A0A1F4Z5R9_9BACT|nr:MAG: Glucose-1-phosphate thymidylyltransferase [Candidatus Amesbacteria bacterium GW2011_GWC1_48_10]KKW00779.1 MAG: Glucose-1-phosphate thymidylyltransferase [Candidatus Amesbacteria bacterium GW2011_GWA1_48_9]OGC89299.1 MAG: spore coat protein [Candidatus Amesbacteria bacterium RBG_19FT_COMBO_48_16]OGC95598.1 MAG: spore coat protein [Candidatus Amesbacteria bacterium RIFCSPHIGHO2_02_FULL_48_21]OGD01649.1 MAG: spore coat protein [Candidatus Amesbacteria bacterium RIFCSPHIGHO2_12_FULL_48_14]
MKGVILAGGLGTRLYPLTYATNKHLLPVFDKPMVFYPLQTLVRAGITEILLVIGGPHAGHFLRVIRNGHHLGIKHLEYAYQENEGGIADALSLAQDFSAGQNMAVILGDNTTDADISQDVSSFTKGALIFLKRVPDPGRYGVPVFSPSDRKILRLEEKPRHPKSPYAVTGLYLYDHQVFDIIRRLKPSGRGELEITDVNNSYLKKGQLQWRLLRGFWTDAGKFETLFKANSYWAKKSRI